MKTKTLSIAVALILLSRMCQAGDDLSIDKYTFRWTVAESGKAYVEVYKTDESTSIVLHDDSELGAPITLSAEEAAAIGKSLSNVDEIFGRFKANKRDAQESHDTNDYAVKFLYSTKDGICVLISPKEQFSFTHLQFDRTQARLFATKLQKAKQLIDFVDKKVSFTPR